MMRSCPKYLYILVMMLAGVMAATAQDTIPPVFTSTPSNITVSCSADIDNTLINWLDNHAGAEADNGEATVMNLINNDEALMMLDQIRSQNCGGTGTLNMGFYAVDTAGNISVDTLMADFIITDNQPPQVTGPSLDVDVYCDTGTADSLQLWLDNIGYASFEDNCSDSIIFSNYNWSDNLGNNGFASPGQATNIQILRETCPWYVDVSFFVEDACGNINVTEARFSITGDTIAPTIANAPLDTIISCSEPISLQDPVFIDGCDGTVDFVYTETNTQSADAATCGYYNYEIAREWQATDACGNTSVYSQLVMIRDTVSPIANAQTVIAIDCNDDLTDLDEFIDFSDNCQLDTLMYRDSVLLSNTCQTQLLRRYTLTDICGNTTNTEQTIQIRDFTDPVFTQLPKDTTVHCSDTDLLEAFLEWRDNAAGAVVNDLCNSVSFRPVAPGVYTDTTALFNAPVTSFNVPTCQPITVEGILGFQIVEFVFYDECGNLVSARAGFTAVDTVSPVIPQCPVDKTVVLRPDQCDTTVQIILPAVTDNCTDPDAERWYLVINDVLQIDAASDTFMTQLSSGFNHLEYVFTDCAANQVSCVQTIEIRDVVPPVLICPEETTVYLENDACEVDYPLLELQDYLEVCSAPVDFMHTLPEGNAYVEFIYNNTLDLYQARNNTVSFRNLPYTGDIYHPEITIEYKLNISPGSSVSLNSELGDILYTIDSASCNENIVTIPLNKTQFDFWLNDQTVNFTINYLVGTGNGVLPCAPGVPSGNQSRDRSSYFKVTLTYSDIVPGIGVVESLSRDSVSVINGRIIIGPGDYELRYTENDAFGNEGFCFTTINVRDTISPELTCKNVIVEAVIQEDPFYDIDPGSLIQSLSDNCAIDSVAISQNRYSCTDIGSSLNIEVSAFDIYGNEKTCNSILTIKAAALKPDFRSNLCFADSLQLLSNVDPDFVSSYKWTGPDGFNSSEPDPLILSIDNNNSGNYILEVVSDDGCVFRGSITLTVNEFSNPQISSDSTTYCVGSNILLNASVFSEDVDYLWYEGVSPNGVLIGETEGPTLAVSPTGGKHFYYVQVRSEDCTSNFSNTISIDVLPVPVAQVSEPFISVCQGQSITLSTPVFSPSFNYLWTGPNGYLSRERIPRVIDNAGLSDAGNYYLTIDNGVCRSDTAVVQVVVLPSPPRPQVSGKPTFCTGQNAVLTVSNIPGATRYYWYRDGILFNTVTSNTLLIPSVTVAQEGSFTVVVEEANCISDTSEAFILDVEPPLNIGAANNGPLCEGDEVMLTSSFVPGAGYTWEDPAGVTYTGREITVPAIEGLYTVTVTSASNCSATSTTTVDLNVRPEITALSNTSQDCMTENMTITLVPTVFPAGNYEYQWTGPDMFASGDAMPLIDNLDDDKNGTYTLQVILGDCASEPVSTVVDFTIIPDPPVIGNQGSVCAGDSLIMTIQNPVTEPGTEYLWATPFGLVTTTIPRLTLPDADADLEGIYSVLVSIQGCRSKASAPVMVDVIDMLPAPSIQGPRTACLSDTPTLTSGPFTGADYIWTAGTDTILTQQNLLNPPAPTRDTTIRYSLQYMVSGCLSPKSNLLEITWIKGPPAPEFEADSIMYCLSDADPLVVCVRDVQDPSVLAYEIIDMNTGDVLVVSENNCIDLDFLRQSPTSNYLLGARSVGVNCLSPVESTLWLQLLDLPPTGAQISTGDLALCQNETLNLTADIPGGVTVTWSSTDPYVSFENVNAQQTGVTGLSQGVIEIILTSHLGQCREFYSDTISVQVQGSLIAQNDAVDADGDENILIDPLFNDVYSGEVTITGITEPSHGSATLVNNQLQYTPPQQFAGIVTMEYTVCYEACPDVCATALVSISLGSESDCFASNVITPNGDGYNDTFRIPCLSSGAYPDNKLVIFNQWGDEIYRASPYSNNWQGTYNGETLPVGTYFYILELGEGDARIQGFIVLEL